MFSQLPEDAYEPQEIEDYVCTLYRRTCDPLRFLPPSLVQAYETALQESSGRKSDISYGNQEIKGSATADAINSFLGTLAWNYIAEQYGVDEVIVEAPPEKLPAPLDGVSLVMKGAIFKANAKFRLRAYFTPPEIAPFIDAVLDEIKAAQSSGVDKATPMTALREKLPLLYKHALGYMREPTVLGPETVGEQAVAYYKKQMAREALSCLRTELEWQTEITDPSPPLPSM